MRASIPYYCDAPPVSYKTPLDWYKVREHISGFQLEICQNGYVYNPPHFKTMEELEKEVKQFATVEGKAPLQLPIRPPLKMEKVNA